MLNGICELDNIDRGGTMVLAQSEGPFLFSVSCPYRTRAVGLIHWCKYNGVCEMRNTEIEQGIREASKHILQFILGEKPMSELWIEYGKGCDIDPEDQERRDLMSESTSRERVLFKALQQREDARRGAKKVLELALYESGKRTDPDMNRDLRNDIRRAIHILEGTDG